MRSEEECKNYKGGEMKKQVYRHGDLCLIKVDKLPEGLKEAKTKVLMTGSGGNDHIHSSGHFYPSNVNNFVFGYFVADEDCKLYHPDHGKKNQKGRVAKLPQGVYELRKQHENTHERMRKVVD